MKHARIFAAEFIGTMLLLVVGFNALFNDGISTSIGLALSVGFTVFVISAVMGPVSDAHVNPAVTIGLALMRKMDLDKVLTYLVAQFLGGLAGALLGFWISRGQDGGFSPNEFNFRISGWQQLSPGNSYDWVSMALVGVIFTGMVVLTYLAVLTRGHTRSGSSLAAGLAYAVVIYAGVEIAGVSVNPALSFGTAVFAGGDAFEQVWLIMLFAFIGAVVGVLGFLAIEEASLEDTMLGDYALARKARDMASSTVNTAAGAASAAADGVGDAAESVKDKVTGEDDD
jgi:aquaporin Z